MVEKDRVCKNCGFLTTSNTCEKCGSTEFIDNYKGKIAIFDVKNSVLAKKLGISSKGKYALKYNK